MSSGNDVWAAVRDRCTAGAFLNVAGLVGHSIGVWWRQEKPMLVPGEPRAFHAGTVVCVEPILDGCWRRQDEIVAPTSGPTLLSDTFGADDRLVIDRRLPR